MAPGPQWVQRRAIRYFRVRAFRHRRCQSEVFLPAATLLHCGAKVHCGSLPHQPHDFVTDPAASAVFAVPASPRQLPGTDFQVGAVASLTLSARCLPSASRFASVMRSFGAIDGESAKSRLDRFSASMMLEFQSPVRVITKLQSGTHFLHASPFLAVLASHISRRFGRDAGTASGLLRQISDYKPPI